MTTCANCQSPFCISKIHLFRRLTHAQQHLIIQHVDHKTYPKGTLVGQEGDAMDHFAIVNTGRFKAYTVNEDGKMKVLDYWGVGSFFGQNALFEPTSLPYTVEAAEDSTLCTIASSTMRNLMTQYPDLAWSVLSELSGRIVSLENELSHLQIEPLERRLMSLLWTLSDDHGKPVEDGRLLYSPLNQEELAMRLGVSRESVNRALKKLESDHKLRILKPRSFILYKM